MTQRLSVTLLLLLLAPAARLAAHNGPPFPIVENKRLGNFTIELWTHPDIGTGTFFVILHPDPGVTFPKDLKLEIGVQPESGRLPEVRYGMWKEDLRDQIQYNTEVQFDRGEFWKVHLLVHTGNGVEDAWSRVEATPTGLGRWDLLWFGAPFAAAGFLWFKMSARKRKLRREFSAT